MNLQTTDRATVALSEEKENTAAAEKFCVGKGTGRNYGIDLLRIISMTMIVTLHVLRQGGILYAAKEGSAQYYAAWLLEALCIGAVNLYAMISGFVGVKSGSVHFYRLASMWLQVEFYCIISSVIVFCMHPEAFSFSELVNRLAPVSTNAYWYFTAYFFMFFFTPFYNKLLNILSEKQLKYLGTVIFLFSSLWPTVWQSDLFELHNGYSFLWLSLLYMLGGIANKLKLYEKINRGIMIGLFAVLMLAGAAFSFCSQAFGWPVENDGLLLSYYSANIVAGSFCLLLAAAKTKISSKVPVKIISSLSPLTFGVYIIHTSEYVWNYVIKGAFSDYSSMPAVVMALAVIGTALLIYLVCSAIDGVRYALFKLIKADAFTRFLEAKIRRAFHQKSIKNESGGQKNEY